MGNEFKRPIKGSGEQDAYTSWRRYYCYLTQAGAIRKIKRTTHKRERAETRREIRDRSDD